MFRTNWQGWHRTAVALLPLLDLYELRDVGGSSFVRLDVLVDQPALLADRGNNNSMIHQWPYHVVKHVTSLVNSLRLPGTAFGGDDFEPILIELQPPKCALYLDNFLR